MRYVVFPALSRLASEHAERHGDLVSVACYAVGDAFDLMEAPFAAMRWYRKAIRAAPDHAEAWRELGCMYERVGCPSRALICLRRSVALSDDPIAKSDLKALLTANATTGAQRTRARMLTDELLASGRDRHALRRARRLPPSPAKCLQLARVYGALGDYEKYCESWTALAQTRGPVVTSLADWHYCQWPITDMPAILTAMVKISPRWDISSSVMPLGIGPVSRSRLAASLERKLAACVGLR